MPIYALVRLDNSIDRRASDIGPDVQTRTGWRWLPVETAGDGPYNPETQVREGPVTAVEMARVLDTFTIRAKTAGEIDADKTARVDNMNGHQALLKALLNIHNRVRALEGQPTDTVAQFKAKLKALL